MYVLLKMYNYNICWQCRVLCTPNLNRHTSTNLGRCAGVQAGVPICTQVCQHAFTPYRHVDTTEILQDKLVCPGVPLARPMQTSLVTQSPTIYNAHIMPSNVQQQINEIHQVLVVSVLFYFVKMLSKFLPGVYFRDVM